MVAGVKELARDWKYDVVSIGYPGPVLHGRPVAEPHNLGPGWVGFDYQAAFGCPVKVINDAAMQALGSYKGGKMLVPGPGDRSGFHHDCRWHRRADGAGPSSLQERHLRGLRRHPRIGAGRQEEMAALCRGRRRPPDRRPRTRRRRPGGRQRQETERAASRLPSRRQRQCVPGRISPLGGRE